MASKSRVVKGPCTSKGQLSCFLDLLTRWGEVLPQCTKVWCQCPFEHREDCFSASWRWKCSGKRLSLTKGWISLEVGQSRDFHKLQLKTTSLQTWCDHSNFFRRLETLHANTPQDIWALQMTMVLEKGPRKLCILHRLVHSQIKPISLSHL